ncbi:hypothetical protein AgCh_006246 [Apium graveolens]
MGSPSSISSISSSLGGAMMTRTGPEAVTLLFRVDIPIFFRLSTEATALSPLLSSRTQLEGLLNSARGSEEEGEEMELF